MKKNKEKVCGIYKITNKVSGKVYVGQSDDINRRWKQHIRLLNKSKHHNTHLQNAWNKYGQDNFIFEILYKQEKYDLSEINRLETEYILKFNSNNQNYGYNANLGGDKPLMNEETKIKLRNSLESVKSKPLHQINKNGEIVNTYKSPREASERFGTSKESIYGALSKINSVSNGYAWVYIEDYESGKFNIKNCDFERRKEVKVVQMDLDFNIISTYDTINEASRQTNICHSSIGDVCLGERCMAGGFYWISYEDYNNGVFSKFNRHKYKKIYQFSRYGELIKKWEDIVEINKETNYDSLRILTACNSDYYYPYEYVWSYDSEFPYNSAKIIKRVVQCDLKLNRIKLWESITNVCTSLDFEYSAILKCCKYEQIKSYGYTWFYEEDFENRYVLHKSHHNNSKQIALFDNKNYIIKKWKSLKEACKELNLKPACVSYRIKYNRLNPDGTKFTYI